MKKKLLVILTVMCLLLGAFAMTGCGKDPEPAKITDGIYEWTLGDGMSAFYRFREDGTYYAKDWLETDAGTYEVKDESFTYEGSGIDGAAEGTEVSGTTTKKVVTNSYTRGVKEFGLAEDGLYGADAPFAQIKNRVFKHKPDFEYDDSKEAASPIYTFYFDNVEGATLVLYHNKTFEDFIGETGIEGTWTKETNGSFKLTADSNVYTLTVSGKSASYIKGTDTLELWNYISNGSVKATFEATAQVNVLGAFDADFRIELYDDYSCKAILNNSLIPVADANGDLVVDTGTWELDMTTGMPVVKFVFETAGNIDSVFAADSTGIEISFETKIFVVAADVDFDSLLKLPMDKLIDLNF